MVSHCVCMFGAVLSACHIIGLIVDSHRPELDNISDKCQLYYVPAERSPPPPLYGLFCSQTDLSIGQLLLLTCCSILLCSCSAVNSGHCGCRQQSMNRVIINCKLISLICKMRVTVCVCVCETDL